MSEAGEGAVYPLNPNPSPGSRSLHSARATLSHKGRGKERLARGSDDLQRIPVQALNGLSTASGLFIVVGLSLIFGVSRIINIAHGSLYMLGTYIAYTFATRIGGPLGFWGGIVATAIVVGLIGALIEICCCAEFIVRRNCSSCWPHSRWCSSSMTLRSGWGPEDLPGPRAQACGAPSRCSAASCNTIASISTARWCC